MPIRYTLSPTAASIAVAVALLAGCNKAPEPMPPPPPATAVLPGGPPIDASSPAVSVNGITPPFPSGIGAGASSAEGGTLSVLPGPPSTPPTTAIPPLPSPGASTPLMAGVPPDPAASPPAAGVIGTPRPAPLPSDQPPSVSPGSSR